MHPLQLSFTVTTLITLTLAGGPDLAALQGSGGPAPHGYELEPARRVRVTPTGKKERVTGHVLRVTEDSLVLELRASPFRNRSELGFEWDGVRDVEVMVGHEQHGTAGALLGIAAGMVGGWLLFYSTPEQEEGALYQPSISGAMGYGLAVLLRRERWEGLPREPRVGDRLRINRRTVGVLASVDSGSLVLGAEAGAAPRRVIPLETVSGLERSLGTRRHLRAGALYGATLGLATIFAGDASYQWLGPPAGALLGLGVGALVKRERWAEALVPDPATGNGPRR